MAFDIVISTDAGSLGDYLSITPVFKKRIGKVICQDSPHTRNFAVIFNDIAEVEFVEKAEPTKMTDEELCVSQRILNYHKIDDCSAIPLIKITDDEKEWAREFLKDYKNPIAFNPSAAAAYRCLPDHVAQKVVDDLNTEGYEVLRFGVKKIQTNIYNNYKPFKNCVEILDLNIRQLAACYSIIRRYAGSDTGDHHLMLSVGGFSSCFVPPSCWHYNHKKHLYFCYAWKKEWVREKYFLFDV